MSDELTFRSPTALETTFLATIVHGYPDLESQLPDCRIADYDPTGYCDVRIGTHPRNEPPFDVRDGPTIFATDETGIKAFVEILLWTSNGILKTIEVVEYGTNLASPYHAFIDAAASGTITYRVPMT